MNMKPVDPKAVIRDPHTKRALPAEGGEVPKTIFWSRRWLKGETWRQDGDSWVRRLPNGRTESQHIAPPKPAGGAPVSTTTHAEK